jgi:hypothetical protein
MFDLFHYLVQSHSLLGRPTQAEIERALDQGRGDVAGAMSSFVSGVGGDRDSLRPEFVRYLKFSRGMLDPRLPQHSSAIEARDRLLAAHEPGSIPQESRWNPRTG